MTESPGGREAVRSDLVQKPLNSLWILRPHCVSLSVSTQCTALQPQIPSLTSCSLFIRAQTNGSLEWSAHLFCKNKIKDFFFASQHLHVFTMTTLEFLKTRHIIRYLSYCGLYERAWWMCTEWTENVSSKGEGVDPKEEYVRWGDEALWETRYNTHTDYTQTHMETHTRGSKVKLAPLSSPNWEELLAGQEGVRFWMTAEDPRLIKNLLSVLR